MRACRVAGAVGSPYRATALVGAVLALAFLLAAAALPASPNAAGVWKAKDRGCYCHAPDPSDAVGFTVTGLPGRYAPGASYTIQVNVTFTDVPAAPNRSQGGFFIEASAGHFEVPPQMAGLVQLDGLQASHTLIGSRARSWSVVWVAPNEAGTVVTFRVAVNTANGNGSETFGTDHWTYKTVTIGVGDEPQVVGPPPPNPPLAFETFGVLAVGCGFGAFALYTFYSARRPAVEGSADQRVRQKRRRLRR